MPDATAKPDAKSKRSITTIRAELDKAKADLKRLHSQVEAANKQAADKAELLEGMRKQWEQANKGLRFDPRLLGIDTTIPEVDPALQREFHGLHYTIARLENELADAIQDSIQA